MKLNRRITGIAVAAVIAIPVAIVGIGAASSGFAVDATMLSGSAAGAAGGAFANCTALNKTYTHGVGKKGAKDKVSGSTKPVTTFTVSNTVYAKNAKSDRDKDGIACEKK